MAIRGRGHEKTTAQAAQRPASAQARGQLLLPPLLPLTRRRRFITAKNHYYRLYYYMRCVCARAAGLLHHRTDLSCL